MRRPVALVLGFIAPLAAIGALPAAARAQQVTVIEQVIEEEWVEEDPGADRFVSAHAPVHVPQGSAAYGPFRVIDNARAALVGVTDERSPAAFSAMLAAHPGISVLELVECPGTDDDRANLALGRMIRAHGLSTHVPDGGSVRSGAVELFLAGVNHKAEPGAEFAVHSWADEYGREARDYAPNAPANRAYLDYYREMGMTTIEARAFYDMTNSVPNASARWLNAAQMGQWVRYN